jgi:hypothetical protein
MPSMGTLSLRHPLRSAVAVALVALGSIGASSASAEADPLDLTGPNVVRYDYDGPLASSARVIRSGERTASGGCRFEAKERVGPGRALRERELAYDPDSCSSLREVGQIPAADLTAMKANGAAGQTQRGAETQTGEKRVGGGSAQSLPQASSLGRFYGFLHSWYEDPIDLHVNDNTAGVNWPPDGTCALPPGDYSIHDYELEWLSETGWSLQSDLFLYGADCTKAYSNEVAHFKNTLFCVPWLDTFVSYHTNQFEGLPDASGLVTYVNEKQGDCADLLQFNVDYAIYQTA